MPENTDGTVHNQHFCQNCGQAVLFSQATWAGSWPLHETCYNKLTDYQTKIIGGYTYHSGYEIQPRGTNGIIWFYLTDFDGRDQLRAMSCIPGDEPNTKHVIDAIPLAWQPTGIPVAVR